MDFDGDGIMDVLSGSWPGQLFFFKGKGKGEFAGSVNLQHQDGKTIKLGSASTVFAADWRGTGKLDLLVGCIEGDVWLVPNEGTRQKPAYGKAQKIEANGKAIRVGHGDSHPIAADWDKDGKLDLLVGAGDGGVLFYRNLGKNGEPLLAAAQTLVPAPKHDYRSPPKEGQYGMRAKICVADWNGDGWLDLLHGDFNSWSGPEPKLSDEDKKAKKEAEAKQQAIFKETKYVEIATRWNKIEQQLQKGDGDVKALTKERDDLQRQMEKIQKRLQESQKVLARFYPSYHYAGNVWLFLRRPPEATGATR